MVNREKANELVPEVIPMHIIQKWIIRNRLREYLKRKPILIEDFPPQRTNWITYISVAIAIIVGLISFYFVLG